jgi:hypothetical protein
MLRRTLTGVGLLLALFHAWVLARQAWAGELVDLAVLGRWLVAAGLVYAVVALRRKGVSVFSGRKAVAIWLLAALLHAPAVARQLDSPDLPAVPDFVVALTQATAAASIVGLVLLAALVFSRAASRRPLVQHGRRDRSRHALPGALAPGAHFVFAPRPPPIA